MKYALCTFLVCLALIGCAGGGSSRSAGSSEANFGCSGSCSNLNLGVADVDLIVRQAVHAANFFGVAATISVSDRVGNILAVYQMRGANPNATVDGRIGASGGLEGAAVPATLAAISKAGTAAYLSSQGNAFSTRTAGQIIQENFNPGERGQPAGPLFGVQFSQLICSDITVLNPATAPGFSFGNNPLSSGLTGPRPLPLGLSADPGGIPLYLQGDLVGGVGVELDGLYTFDRDLGNRDNDLEEIIAMVAATGFAFPEEIAGDRIFVLGKSLRTSDISADDLIPLPESLPELQPELLVPVPLFFRGSLIAGATFGSPSSGVMKTTRAGVPAAILVNQSGAERFPSRASNVPADVALQADEVDALLTSILLTANRTRAAIRTPRDTAARVSIWIVDIAGTPLGFVRSEDAPVFGIDVALQKARTAAFFSSADAGATLDAVRARNGVGAFADYTTQVRNFLGAFALTGTHAFSDRAGGNLSRPFYPDGINGNAPGPLSLPFPGSAPGRSWSPFNTGLQLDLVFQRLVQPLGIPAPTSRTPDSCTDTGVLGNRLRNGIQIFPGSVPIYRDSILVGGVGISGDGVDQDDLIAFYGSSRAGLDFAGHSSIGHPSLGFNAPREIRADTIETPVGDTRLRFVNCPESPFIASNEQKVCGAL